jgi:hypothetical protein
VLSIAAWQVRTLRRQRQRRREDPMEADSAGSLSPGSPEDQVLSRELDELLLQLPDGDAETLRAWARDERPPLPPEANFDRRTGIHHWADSYYDLGPEEYSFVSTNEFGSQRIEQMGYGIPGTRWGKIAALNRQELCWRR